MLENNEEWKQIGGKLLVSVHDEILVEVPLEHYKRGGEILSSCMCEAANFLPFPSKCDVTTMLRWYGMEYPCKYKKPENLNNLDSEGIKWVQYHLFEMEYQLPIIKNEDGSKPIGDAALGVNGISTDEFKSSLNDYMITRNIKDDRFLDVIEHEVLYHEVIK